MKTFRVVCKVAEVNKQQIQSRVTSLSYQIAYNVTKEFLRYV